MTTHLARRLKKIARFLLQSGVRILAAFPWTRAVLNAAYLKISRPQRTRFLALFRDIFRSSYIPTIGGSWKVLFAGKRIVLPLTSERMWLDWDIALWVDGHDHDVKQTYEALLRSSERPELFIDIGANYGTHSLLFLVHQVPTLTFEPNAASHEYFKSVCEFNRVRPELEPVALGERPGHVELSYPHGETWLGSTDTAVSQDLEGTYELSRARVEQRRLDDYLPQIASRRTLIKIDTEGSELSVLRGAAQTLQQNRPRVIFETWENDQRGGLFDFFASRDYLIYTTPWSPAVNTQPLTRQQFLTNRSENFIAVPVH